MAMAIEVEICLEPEVILNFYRKKDLNALMKLEYRWHMHFNQIAAQETDHHP